MNLVTLIDNFNDNAVDERWYKFVKRQFKFNVFFGQHVKASAELLYFGGVQNIEVTKDDKNHGLPKMKFIASKTNSYIKVSVSWRCPLRKLRPYWLSNRGL